MRFTLGRPVFALLLVALASGSAVLVRPAEPRANLVVWTFSQAQADFFRNSSLPRQFENRTGFSVGISLMGQSGENIRLASAFMSDGRGAAAPDLCEIEIDAIGQFLRPPIRDIGLLPLNDFLARSGWESRIVASRLAPWSKTDPATGRQIICGIPEDVHPVAIAYRKDLFEQAGIDLAQAKSWNEFQSLCQRFESFWASRGFHDRRAIALSTSNPDELLEMLLQRHINLIDSDEQLHFTDAKVLGTLTFYARMIAGSGAVAGEPSPGVQWTEDLEHGNICAICAPDWKVDDLRRFSPDLAGKIALMPMPRFEPDDSATSTLGGTMIGICRSCPDPERAWELLEYLVLSPQSHESAIAAGDDVLPAVSQYWSDPAYHRPDAFFAGGQSADDLFVTLAAQIPQRVVTPFTYQAELALGVVLHRSVTFLRQQGPEGLDDACAGWLADAQNDIGRRIEFGKIEP